MLDDEGDCRSGDAACFVDPRHEALGLMFDSRIEKDFKRMSGTRVSLGSMLVQPLCALHARRCAACLQRRFTHR